MKISPVAEGAGTGNCVPIACPAGHICADAYSLPEEMKTRVQAIHLSDCRVLNPDDSHGTVLRPFKLGGLIFASRMGISASVERLSTLNSVLAQVLRSQNQTLGLGDK